jgi:anti-anti-sigma regulatory factor
MATHITQTQHSDTGQTVLAVKGEMLLDDALLLERIARSMRKYNEGPILIDLADLDFLDSESAAVLKRLSDDEENFRLEGIEIFLQTAIDAAERSGSGSEQ